MPKCKDSRKCILRGTARDKQECLVLQEVYEDGKCLFCKANRSDINGFTHRPAKNTRKTLKKPAPKITGVYAELHERIQLVANHHGARWREELKFLESVRTELLELAKMRDRDRWRIPDEEPDDGQAVLMTVVEEGSEEAKVRIGRYRDGEFETEAECYVFAWKPLCDPWEVLSEAEDDAE